MSEDLKGSPIGDIVALDDGQMDASTEQAPAPEPEQRSEPTSEAAPAPEPEQRSEPASEAAPAPAPEQDGEALTEADFEAWMDKLNAAAEQELFGPAPSNQPDTEPQAAPEPAAPAPPTQQAARGQVQFPRFELTDEQADSIGILDKDAFESAVSQYVGNAMAVAAQSAMVQQPAMNADAIWRMIDVHNQASRLIDDNPALEARPALALQAVIQAQAKNPAASSRAIIEAAKKELGAAFKLQHAVKASAKVDVRAQQPKARLGAQPARKSSVKEEAATNPTVQAFRDIARLNKLDALGDI